MVHLLHPSEDFSSCPSTEKQNKKEKKRVEEEI